MNPRIRLLPGALLLAAALPAQTSTYAVVTDLTPAVVPPDRIGALMAYDGARNRVLLAGGQAPGNTSTRNDTWEWNGTTWTQVFPTTQLNFARPTHLVYAPQRGRILAVSGELGLGGTPMRIHEWTGSNWLLVNSTGLSSRAEYFNVAWDSVRGVLVLFGHPYLGETWEWDGVNWAQRGTGGPVPRYGHEMAFDPVRQVTVLYGGISFNNYRMTDTWEWNGTYWLERFGIASPPICQREGFAYDPARQRIVLHGGDDVNGGQSNAVYEFDGNGWINVPVQGSQAITQLAMAPDPSGHGLVSFGGIVAGVTVRTRRIELITGYVATSTLHGAGCAGPVGVPSLLPVGTSRPVLGTTFQLRFGNLPNSALAPVFATIGFQDQTFGAYPLPFALAGLGMPGCFLRVEPTNTQVLSNTSGIANWPIPLPNAPVLDGLPFFVQGGVLVAGFNPAGIVISDSRAGVLGRL